MLKSGIQMIEMNVYYWEMQPILMIIKWQFLKNFQVQDPSCKHENLDELSLEDDDHGDKSKKQNM